MHKRPCVFFDRDGIVNVSPGPGYVERWEDFHLIPAFLESLRVANEKGYAAAIITNQRGVGRGIMTMATLDLIHSNLLAELARHDLLLLDIYSCTVDEKDHPDRKPNPGMILKAAQKHHLDLSKSWMIGDHETDVLAGKRAGCRTVLVNTGHPESTAEFRIESMDDLPELLRRQL